MDLRERIYDHLLHGNVDSAINLYREFYPGGTVEQMYTFIDTLIMDDVA